VPHVEPVPGKPGRVRNARGQEFDAEDRSDARHFSTEHGACDKCHVVVPHRELADVWMRIGVELEPISLCRSCVSQCVFVPGDEWERMRSQDRASRWVRQLWGRFLDAHE
jgi:hypothetical protein